MTTQNAPFKSRNKPPISARDYSSLERERPRAMKAEAESAVAQPFRGIFSGGALEAGLFPISSSGVATGHIRAATMEYLASLDATQREGAVLPVDGDDWRRWSNVHMYLLRHGLSLELMNTDQREKALGILRATLSPAGFAASRDIMRLNETLREITGSDVEFGEWPYWMSILGEPSATEPWGWQIDGHHLIINCFILGDQVVLTPFFMGSEPTFAHAGKYAGVRAFAEEENRALVLAQSLNQTQWTEAVIGAQLPDEIFGAAFRDNFELSYEGVRFDSLSKGQLELASNLLDTYLGRLGEGHFGVWKDNVNKHLDRTYLAWCGGRGDDDAFYYRVHSPVILIEFDHLAGIALEPDEPSRNHIHTVIRTPNGNDYGKDLLRQHYEQTHRAQR